MFVSDLGAIAAEPNQASARRCRAVLRAVHRMRVWLDAREKAWSGRLDDLESAEAERSGFFAAQLPFAIDDEYPAAS